MQSPFVSTEEIHLKRRRVPRRKIRQRVGLLISGEYHLNYAFEVGEGGMLLESEVPLEIEKQIVVSFSLPGTNTALRAIVKYISEPNETHQAFRYGVQFEDIGFETRRKIRNFVAAAKRADETGD